MAKIAKLNIKPYSRFHFGELKLDDNLALSSSSLFAHSDTLFSALVNSFSKFNGGAEDFMNSFKNGDIKISSLFYYLSSNDKTIYFLPKPIYLNINSPKDGLHKFRNRIKFVSLDTWENGFEQQKWIINNDKSENNNEYFIINEQFVITKNEFAELGLDKNIKISKITDIPKSPIRAHKNAAIYYQANLEIAKNDGLNIGWYFLYEANGEYETNLKIATNVMAYSGIGGEISNTGRTIDSAPTFENIDISINEDKSNEFVNLSLFIPKDEKEFNKVNFYETFLRGGRKTLTGNTSIIRMIKEGASINNNELFGKMVELGIDENNNKIFRNGIPLLIPVKYEN